MEYYSTIKKEMKPGHCRDVNRPRVCQSEVSQKEKNK